MPLRLRATPQSYVRKSSKYGVRTDARGKRERTIDGILFASKRECQRYLDLRLLEKAGKIRSLVLQPSLALMAPVVEGALQNINEGRIVGMRPLGEWRGDFRYEERRGTLWSLVYEDTKGFDVRFQRWKRIHAERQYSITVRLT
jgi:hypothetical protein